MTYLDEIVQAYLDRLYKPFYKAIQSSRAAGNNETYGEIFYYSAYRLLRVLQIDANDHFLDIGSGVGKLVLQTFLRTSAKLVTGIEINESRHTIATKILGAIKEELPNLFENQRNLQLIHGDFLKIDLRDDITLVYLCSTVFSFDLLAAMGQKINAMPHVRKVVSFRVVPHLDNFALARKLFLHCSWDRVPCYVYVRRLPEKKFN